MRQPICFAQHAYSHEITVTDFAIGYCDQVAMVQPVIETPYCKFITPEVNSNVINTDLSVKLPDKPVSYENCILQENLWTYQLVTQKFLKLFYRRQGLNSYKSINMNKYFTIIILN